jgi:tetratricopeptide (TPR) repeat protein
VSVDEHFQAAFAALDRGAFDEADQHLRAAERAATTEAELALVHMRMAGALLLQGRRDVDLNVFRENVVRRHSTRHVCIATYYLLITAIDTNDRASAERYLPLFLDATRELDDPAFTLKSYDIVAAMESLRGNHVAALEYDSVAIAESEKYTGDDALSMRAFVTHNAVYNCLAANRFADALALAPTALELAEQLGNPHVLRQCVVTVAFAHLSANQLDETARLAARAAELAAGTRLERYAHYLLGEVARRRGDTAEAATHFRKLEAFYPDIPGVSEMLLSMNVAPFLMPE